VIGKYISVFRLHGEVTGVKFETDHQRSVVQQCLSQVKKAHQHFTKDIVLENSRLECYAELRQLGGVSSK